MGQAELQAELEAQIAGEVRFDRISRALYSTDASVYQIEPLGIVVVKSREDVVRTVDIARRHGVSITARGGGTSQAGQAIGAGLVLDMSKYFNRVIDIDTSERMAWVEPGVVLDELNAALRLHGLRFAPDISTASRATIGGMIANNSSGARSVLYGKTIDHVVELDVVLADGSFARLRQLDAAELDARCADDGLEAECYRAVRRVAAECAGEIERRFPKVLRRVGGYNLDEFGNTASFNLAKLIVGSEGTLGIVVAAKINLVPLPKAKAVLTIEFDELLDALGATPAILKHRPSAVEVMDGFILGHARENATLDALRRSLVGDAAGALLCVEFYDDTPAQLLPRLDALERELEQSQVPCRTRRATTTEAQARIWSFREAALGLSMAMKGDAKSLSFVEDTAVAPEKLREYIRRFLELIARHGTSAGVYAHASVGCLHVRPVVNLKTEEGIARFEAIARDVSDLVLEFGGALSGEHGDGLVRGPFTEKMFGPILYDAFRTVKKTFDPAGIFNPGKIVDSPPLTSNLRYGVGYKAAAPLTYFDFSEHGGMAGAVEMCSGLGACRKKLDGTMCPSYMATLEEKHSTRGRANVLRLAMAGRLGEAGLGDEEVRDVLDLCLECRACKAECPVGVDVARFKSEFLADYWRRHGTPLRARAIGHIHSLAKWGSRLAPVSNFVAGLGSDANPWRKSAWRRLTPASPRVELTNIYGARRTAGCQSRTADSEHSALSVSLRGHVHQLQPSGAGNRRVRGDCSSWFRRSAGVKRLLRPAAHFAGSPRRRTCDGRGKRQVAVRHRGTRRSARVSRTELSLRRARGRAGSPSRRPAEEGPRGRGCLRVVRGFRRACAGVGRRRAANSSRTIDRSSPRSLPSKSHGPPGLGARAALAHTGMHGGRSGCWLLRDGRLVWLFERALRRVTTDR